MGLITLSQITNGSSLDATVPNNNFTTLANEFNGNIDNANVKPTANIAGSKLADNSVGVSKLTSGTINLVHAVTSATVATGTLAAVTGGTGTVTVPASARSVQVTFCASYQQNTDGNSAVQVAIFKDGVQIRSRYFHVSLSGIALGFTLVTQDDAPAAGSHTYSVQISYTGGAAAPSCVSGGDFLIDLV